MPSSFHAGSSRARLAVDSGICAALAAGTIAYLRIWPRDFFPLDEGLYLYESRRLLEGGVFYRDMFELITPGAHYAMAAVFAVFGVDVGVARMAMAAVHASIAILVFLSCRRLGVRRSFSCTAAVAHLAVAFPAMSKASPHWFATLLTLLVLYLLLRVPWRRPSAGLLLVGLANGALIMVQQQKGVVVAAGVLIALVLDHLLARRDAPLPLASLRDRLALFLAAAGGLAGFSTMLLILGAGLRPLWEQLVLFPLGDYSGQAHCSEWGFRGKDFFVRYFPFAVLVRNLPFIAGLGLVRVLAGWILGAESAALRGIAVASLIALFATLSVAYCPNHIHLAVVAPVQLVLLAAAAEILFAGLGRWTRAAVPLGLVAAGLMLALIAPEMRRSLERSRKTYPFAHQTVAGVVDFRNPEETMLVDMVTARTHAGDEIFAYPTYPGLYFLSGTTNPTRFQILMMGYNTPEHFSEVLEVLERKKTRFIAVNTFSVRWKTDPVTAYLWRAYRRVPLSIGKGQIPHFLLFERKPEGAWPPRAEGN